MKRKTLKVFILAAMIFSLALSMAQPAFGAVVPQNANSSTGQMKASGSEVGKAGKSMGRNVKRGRIVRGGKHFGKHFGKAGKHFGRGTKKAFKRAIS
jgi:hypothetical protein